jgi:lysophospholipase L1-like esterase
MIILCIGDSNTLGYDPRSYYGSRYSADVKWTDQLENYTVVNCGMNCLSIPQNAAVYKELIRSRKPDLTIVMLGSNDLLE